MDIKSVSNLKRINSTGIKDHAEKLNPIPLPKNRRSLMTATNLDQRSQAIVSFELALDAADHQAKHMSSRCTHDEVFGSVRAMLHGGPGATA